MKRTMLPEDLEAMKKLLKAECTYQLPEEMLESFIESMTEFKLKAKTTLISNGEINDNIYIVKDGIIRACHMNGSNEITTGFAMPGTMIVSWHSFYFNKPSFYQMDACCNSTILQLPKKEFEKRVAESHEFAQWALSMAHCQLYFDEYKQSVINGDAKERYISLLKNRPDILQNVPLGIVASYLGITQQYLSYIRRQLRK